jgi:hypothetical protein
MEGRKKRRKADPAAEGGSSPPPQPPQRHSLPRRPPPRRRSTRRPQEDETKKPSPSSPLPCWYDRIDDESRIRILGYLSPSDLAEACLVSTQFARDCFHGSLPAVDRTAALVLEERWGSDVLSHGGDAEHLRRLVTDLAGTASFGRSVNALEISTRRRVPYGDGPLLVASVPAARRSRSGLAVPGVHTLRLIGTGERIAALSTATLLPLLPDLRHLEYSGHFRDVPVDELSSFGGIADRFRSLVRREGILWHDGRELAVFRNVRDLCLDGSTICFRRTNVQRGAGAVIRLGEPAASRVEAMEDEDHENYLLCRCGLPLERVSLRALRCQSIMFLGAEGDSDWENYRRGRWGLDSLHPEVSQLGLIKFVRRTPTLRWFRADLTAETVALLRRERPDVTLVVGA